MALLDAEIDRIKYELGYNLLDVGAEPYIGVAAIFSQVIQVYLRKGASTTSATAVVAQGSPTSVALTLTSAVGFAPFARVIVDVDELQESAMVSTVAGSAITLPLSKAHTGTYPVTVEGGESIVRSRLRVLRSLDDRIERAGARAGVKKVDEIEFFGGKSEKDILETLQDQQAHWRSELCRALFGVGSLQQLGSGGGGAPTRMELY